MKLKYFQVLHAFVAWNFQKRKECPSTFVAEADKGRVRKKEITHNTSFTWMDVLPWIQVNLLRSNSSYERRNTAVSVLNFCSIWPNSCNINVTFVFRDKDLFWWKDDMTLKLSNYKGEMEIMGFTFQNYTWKQK